MSGKSKKQIRQALQNIRFPEVVDSRGNVINHKRRIVSVAKADGITIQAALEKHVRKTGLMPKPKLSEIILKGEEDFANGKGKVLTTDQLKSL